MSPTWVLTPAFALFFALLSYAFWPHRRRNFVAILVLCLIGAGLGQLWEYLQLPSVHIGEGNLLPAAVFAAALQPLASKLPIHFPSRGGKA